MHGFVHDLGTELRGNRGPKKAAIADLCLPLVQVLPLFFYLLHLHSPHISMQVMARAGNTVVLRDEVKETKLDIFSVLPPRDGPPRGGRPSSRALFFLYIYFICIPRTLACKSWPGLKIPYFYVLK